MFNDITIQEVKLQAGALVKLMRKREGLTQAQLADKLALSRLTIQNLEAGRNATMDTLLKVLQHNDMLSGFAAYIATEATNNNYESLY
ncbi:MAG: helix-turn-helix domain-containing protein [Taibaiella sp.]|nr:helix-turn-helix domain-containing protein [Taibaiella sp.]